jgi:hypothetical protein
MQFALLRNQTRLLSFDAGAAGEFWNLDYLGRSNTYLRKILLLWTLQSTQIKRGEPTWNYSDSRQRRPASLHVTYFSPL